MRISGGISGISTGFESTKFLNVGDTISARYVGEKTDVLERKFNTWTYNSPIEYDVLLKDVVTGASGIQTGAGSGGISSLTSDLNDDGKVDANDLLNLLESDYLNDSRLTKMQSEYGKEETPWSAALVSSLAGYMDPTFVKSARHSDYIGRAFRGEGNYVPQKLHSNKIINGKEEFKVGDILFGGRPGQASYGKGYNWYKRKGRNNKGYGSHGDIIVDTGVDKNGRWYDIQGGNMSNQLYSRRVYAKDFGTWGKNYRGKLTV